MSTFRKAIVPSITAVLTLRARGSDTALSPTYTGTEVSGRTGLYEFDIGARANGDYDAEVPFDGVVDRFALRVASSGNTVADSWNELELLDAIDDLGNNVTITSYSPVAASGQIESPIIIGDDYLAEYEKDFYWLVDAIPGLSIGNASCVFGIKKDASNSMTVNGTVSLHDVGVWKLSFDVAKEFTQDLDPGQYDWSVEVQDQNGKEMTSILSECKVELRRKQT
jgi:hypothetical protein